MAEEIYSQLARLVEAFPVQVTQQPIIAVGTFTLQAKPTRVYLAFNVGPVTTPLLYIPDSLSKLAQGYPVGTSNSSAEFWVEKHKSMVGGQWIISNPNAGIIAVTIVEIFYATAD